MERSIFRKWEFKKISYMWQKKKKKTKERKKKFPNFVKQESSLFSQIRLDLYTRSPSLRGAFFSPFTFYLFLLLLFFSSRRRDKLLSSEAPLRRRIREEIVGDLWAMFQGQLVRDTAAWKLSVTYDVLSKRHFCVATHRFCSCAGSPPTVSYYITNGGATVFFSNL